MVHVYQHPVPGAPGFGAVGWKTRASADGMNEMLEGATPEVAARLAEITVEPKNVVLEDDQNHQKPR